MTPPGGRRPRLLVATHSEHKLRELRQLLALPVAELVSLDDIGVVDEPVEDGDTFEANAAIKARAGLEATGLPTLADDSGLEVDALGGAPGPRSARWSAEGTDAANNALLLEQLAGMPEARRTARYRCIVAFLATPSSVPEIVEATCDGFILTEPRGKGGFGYDPLFFSPELHMTFGEAPPAAKHRVSHRGRAFRALIEVLLRRST